MQAFEGIRVLDFTHVYAGPFASYQLAVMGAEVIKIESPHVPDMMRAEGSDPDRNALGLGLSYCVNNQGKKAITLDISKPEGVDIAKQLIATADVLIENYVGAMQRYGLGAKEAHEINPRLIYCSMSGYGTGSAKEGCPAFDNVIQAFSGMMSANGNPTQERLRVGPPLIDYGTGAQSAFSIASALFQRSRTGKGQVIEVNMVDAALMMMSPLIANAIYRDATEERVGNFPETRPGFCVYRCEDDDIMLGVLTANQHINLFRVLGFDDLVQQASEITRDWIADRSSLIRRRMIECFKTRTAQDWEDRLNQSDVPAARVRDLYQMLKSDQLHRAAASQHKRLSDSELTAPIAAFNYATDGPKFDSYCAQHGEDTDSVLSDLGLSANELDHLRKMAVI
ncbi:MAG: crotonobetainyl-CoA:carnitine CoA-transferase CaiB-like acyl-CoA transferase [Gammaproteobacteria bacterium]|jgi:crotonobetainyl-CoA:carnitine CoA-transferase CaiB-like acyl-CoA transferase